MDHRHARPERHRAALHRCLQRRGRVPLRAHARPAQLARQALGGLRARRSHDDLPARGLVRPRHALQRRALPGPCLPDDHRQPPVRARRTDRVLLLAGQPRTLSAQDATQPRDLAVDELAVDRLDLCAGELVGGGNRPALKRAVRTRGLPAVHQVEDLAALVHPLQRRQRPRTRLTEFDATFAPREARAVALEVGAGGDPTWRRAWLRWATGRRASRRWATWRKAWRRWASWRRAWRRWASWRSRSWRWPCSPSP